MPWLGGTRWAEPTLIVKRDFDGRRFEPDPRQTVWFEHVRVEGVDFQGTSFGDVLPGRKDAGGLVGGFISRGCLFVDCDFSRVRFEIAQLGHTPQSVFRR